MSTKQRPLSHKRARIYAKRKPPFIVEWFPLGPPDLAFDNWRARIYQDVMKAYHIPYSDFFTFS